MAATGVADHGEAATGPRMAGHTPGQLRPIIAADLEHAPTTTK
jgi:hypothetical protein